MRFHTKGMHDILRKGCSVFLLPIVISVSLIGGLYAQTSVTGALTGVTLGPSGAILPGVALHLVNERSLETLSATSDGEGRYWFLRLSPGAYDLHATKSGFDSLLRPRISISVTETLRLDLRLRLATVINDVLVPSQPEMLQTDDSALGRTVNGTAVSSLPLVTRNFAQIAGLSPGVVSGVFNAGELGLGGMAQSQVSPSNDGIFVHGGRSYDNNWQLDGISMSDVQGSGSSSGGIPIPNPDAIQEFKLQTGLYDAAYGRYADGNVSIVTRMGGNTFHGSIFEFLRNDVLNANDYFFKRAGQQRPTLKQNQFGFTLGGPLKRDKLFFFGSYQGTRQINGLAAGQTRVACAANLTEPPLTNDRSAAALGAMFGGMKGALGGVAVKLDGSNINPVALALLNFKLADGSYLVPVPQTIDSSRPLASQGFAVFTQPCHFDEDQSLDNMDYFASEKSKFSGRFFWANDHETVTFPGNGLNSSGNIRGFPSPLDSGFIVFSMANTYALTNTSVNEARVGYVRNRTETSAESPFAWSDIGVAEGNMTDANRLPSLNIIGSVSIAPGYPRAFTQNTLSLGDNLSFVRGAHTVTFGGSMTRLQDNINIDGFGSLVEFLSWPDFLLGLDGAQNGTGTFSNVFASADVFGLLNREYRVWEDAAFAQDNFRLTRSLVLNLGLRYERLGQFADKLGRNSSFDIRRADPNPPATGTLAGYVVASNFTGPVPAGVVRAKNEFANDGVGQNTISPRVGFAWQLPSEGRSLLRAGYGAYYSRPTGQAFYQNVFGAPFSLQRVAIGHVDEAATFQQPFAQPFPTPASFPLFPAYSPTTATGIFTVAQKFRPAAIHQYSLNVQWQPHEDWLFEAGYVGTRGTHLQRSRSLNQAMSASAGNPIRGVSTNTIGDISLRVPIVGVPANLLFQVESEGSSWYNGLEVSLTKRLKQGFQLLASYTFSKTLDTDGADINSTSAGVLATLGDQNSPQQRWGRTSFDRTHRFVFSGNWTLPSPPDGVMRATLGGWSLAGVVTIQSGTALTIADTNSTNVFGISRDRAQLTGRCGNASLVSGGSIESKLNHYFNRSCFTTPPVIGADGIGTTFGNSATGIATGPAQENLDLALSKTVPFAWSHDNGRLEFRAEFYNALNHPQFANPDSTFTSPTFGLISSTSVNARVGQLGLKFTF